MRQRTKQKMLYSTTRGILVGILIMVCSLLTGIGVISLFVAQGNLDIKNTQYMIYAIVAVAVCAAVCVSAKLVNRKVAIIGSSLAGIMFLLLTGMHLLFFGGKFEGVVGVVVSILLGTTGGLMSHILSPKTIRKMKNR